MTSEFSDQLSAVVPGAIPRLQFLERGIKHVLDREIEAYRKGEPHPRITVIDSDEPLRDGLLLTEPGLPEVPECMVWFEFHADFEQRRDVVLWGIGPTPTLDEREDYSDDP